jgi:hypothetical protein
MKPKEKAEELVETYFKSCSMYFDPYLFNEDLMEQAKECAMICVEELIAVTGSKYWYDVKKHIAEC